MSEDISLIRNFSIVAHIDHGKSTIADRLIELCQGLEEREMKQQVLDSMDIERERGITIKAQTVRLLYESKKNKKKYILNLLDTPGHVDFSYEVSRSLAACEGSLLIVDSTQGVEAQTLSNVYKAIDANHEIIIILNKKDLPASEPERIKSQIESVIGLDTEHSLLVSAKTGDGIEDILEQIVDKLPPPKGNSNAPLKAMLVDSWYDKYLGIIVLVRIIDGKLEKGMKIKMISTGGEYIADTVGIFTPKKVIIDSLNPGEIGFITGNIKNVSDCKVGDTITSLNDPCSDILLGFKPVNPVVFCSIFPVDTSDFTLFRESLEKLHLNDASFSFQVESSGALGYGFRCGFLGMLHLEIIQERIEREFDLDIITTAPSVIYRVYTKKSEEMLEIHNPADMPDTQSINKVEEPWVTGTILLPDEYIGDAISLCMDKRGEQVKLDHVGNGRNVLIYKLPLSEIIFDFNDKLKSISRGYASFDWEVDEYRDSEIVNLGILINSEPVDALSLLVHKTKADKRGRDLCIRLKDLIPRQQFKIAIQASIGSKIIARETIQAFRKDVTAKLYGGDRTRKDKLLKKQKKGKKRMREIGNINMPSNVFIDALKMDNN